MLYPPEEVKGGGAMNEKKITQQTITRLPGYLNYLSGLQAPRPKYISSCAIAQALALNEVVTRKDLAAVCPAGKPRVGYPLETLENALKAALSYGEKRDAVLVGAGKLGRALIGYEGFGTLMLNIVAAFDIRDLKDEGSVPVLPLQMLGGVVKEKQILIGIITTPAQAAQDACDGLIRGGVKAIWNFAPVRLKTPDGILVQNENMAASLAILSAHLKKTNIF